MSAKQPCPRNASKPFLINIILGLNKVNKTIRKCRSFMGVATWTSSWLIPVTVKKEDMNIVCNLHKDLSFKFLKDSCRWYAYYHLATQTKHLILYLIYTCFFF